MAVTQFDGPLHVSGDLQKMLLAAFGTSEPDPNPDAGPSAFYQGNALLDPRFFYEKDRVSGWPGRVPMHTMLPSYRSVNQIPAALGTANISALANAVNGTAVTLAGATVGVTPNIPIIPFNQGGINNLANGVTAPTTVPLTLDFGYAFGNCTSGTAQIVVANAYDFTVGQPLVIAGVGNAGGTIPLLTTVKSIDDTTHITLNNAPLATLNPAAIGNGNIWGPNEAQTNLANMTPTAHLPWIAAGPGLFLDSGETITRALQITGSAGGTGGSGGLFTVRGWDVYGVPMREDILAPVGATTTFGIKAWKYILSITPNFADAHNYSIGTSDVFGFNYKCATWEDCEVSWNGTAMTSNQGYAAPLAQITVSTATTADVRGTIQTGAAGGGTGIGSNASNGTVSSLAMSGRRLMMQNVVASRPMVLAQAGSAGNVANAVNVPNSSSLFGNAQFFS